jgi:hypothetical protein
MSSQQQTHRRKLRYLFISNQVSLMNSNLSKLCAEFNAQASGRGENPVHLSVFHRVARGEKTSARIQLWLARRLKINPKELWS